ncbi:MAG: MFS transporter, partial [Armatimonadetes bacterium]|nr:MFS transporter [Candidatus Hippobium faecium]
MTEKFQRFASASCFICLFAYAATLCVSHACNNEINRLFHITNTQMGLLFMMIYVGFIPATLLTGRLSDTKGKLPVVFAGTVFMILGLLLFILTKNFYVGLGAMFLMGLGGGCSETNATGLIGDIYTGAKRTRMLSFVQTSFGLGALAGPLIAGMFLKYTDSYNGAFITISAITFIGFLFVLFSLMNNEEKPVGVNTEKVPWNVILRDKYIWLIVAGLILYCGAELGFSGWIAVYFEKILCLGKSYAVQSVALIWLGIATGSAFFAMLAKKLTPLNILKISLSGVILMFCLFYV